jgi:hypothetical protein
MPARKTTGIASVSDEALGNFAVSDYSERLYAKVYYAIRERQGFLSQKRNRHLQKFVSQSQQGRQAD